MFLLLFYVRILFCYAVTFASNAAVVLCSIVIVLWLLWLFSQMLDLHCGIILSFLCLYMCQTMFDVSKCCLKFLHVNEIMCSFNKCIALKAHNISSWHSIEGVAERNRYGIMSSSYSDKLYEFKQLFLKLPCSHRAPLQFKSIQKEGFNPGARWEWCLLTNPFLFLKKLF